MAYPLNNVTVSSDSYTDANTCRFQLPVQRATVVVANQAVYMEVGQVPPGARAESAVALREEYLVPGSYTLNRGYLMGFLRFRRATTGLNAQVTAR